MNTPSSFTNFVSSGYYALVVMATLIGVVVFQVRSDTHRDEQLTNIARDIVRLDATDKLISTRVDDIDVHGSRGLQLLEQRMHDFDARLQEFGRRINAAENQISESSRAGAVALERHTNILDELKRNDTRLNDRLDRIVQALDHVYALVTQQPKSFPPDGPRGDRPFSEMEPPSDPMALLLQKRPISEVR